MIDYITQNAELLETIGIFFPFILAAILKSAQGSSTVALTTTAGIVAPILRFWDWIPRYGQRLR